MRTTVFTLSLFLTLLIGCAGKQEPVPERKASAPADPVRADETTGTIVPIDPPVDEIGSPPGDIGTPPASRFKNVTLASPAEGEAIRSNPFTIRGTARTFENNVVLRVRDEKGRPLITTSTTATGEMGKFSPYSREVYLTSWPGNRVTVEAFESSAKDGSEQSLVRVEAPLGVEKKSVKLFFSPENSNDCTRVVAVTREVPSSRSLARLLGEGLIAGPLSAEKSKGLTSPFPQGSAIRSVNLRDGVLTVDFNEPLSNVGGSCRAQAIRSMVEKTMAELPTVKKVRITSMGLEETALQP